jgi:hypothetical protein
MTGRWRWVLALVLLLLLAGPVLAACGPDDEFTRKCRAKGGVVHRDGHSLTCKPPPVPRPQPNWQ